MTKKKRIDTTSSPALSSSPFAGLAGLRGALPASAPRDEVAASPQTATRRPDAPRRAIVRYSRKGRGGKEVTFVERLELPRTTLEEWLRQLKKTLGVGGYIEEDRLVLSGDQRERLAELLRERGVWNVTVS